MLGNYRLRKLYDKGIIHTAGKDYSHHASAHAKTQPVDDTATHPEDDPQTKFYKSRLRRTNTTPTGHKIYDFDEWTAQHYSDTFQKNRKGKQFYTGKRDRDFFNSQNKSSLNLPFVILSLTFLFFILAELILKNDPDRPVKSYKKDSTR